MVNGSLSSEVALQTDSLVFSMSGDSIEAEFTIHAGVGTTSPNELIHLQAFKNGVAMGRAVRMPRFIGTQLQVGAMSFGANITVGNGTIIQIKVTSNSTTTVNISHMQITFHEVERTRK
jgi:hypothetical protein